MYFCKSFEIVIFTTFEKPLNQTTMEIQVKSWRKKEIKEKLKGFNRETVRSTIIRVIMECRNIPEDYAKNARTLKESEVLIILKQFE